MPRLRIQEVSQQRELNQKELSQRSGVSPQVINRYWNNRTGSVSLAHLGKIAQALQVTPGELIAGDGEQAVAVYGKSVTA